MFPSQKGFTLLELLIVIVVISILTLVGFSSYGGYVNRAKIADAKSDLTQFINAANVARTEQNNVALRSITGSGWSANGCFNKDLRNIASTDACYINWNNALDAVIDYSRYTGLEKLRRDPWGSPYLLDENEGEQPATPCRRDWVRSAGPDGQTGSPSNAYNADDIILYPPFATSQC